MQMQIDMARSLLEKAGAQPVAVRGQMSVGHSFLETPFWWDKESCGGPIVEQVTYGPPDVIQHAAYRLVTEL